MAIPPRVSLAPKDSRANSAEDVIDLSSTFGLELDDWQQWLLWSALGERADGSWSAMRVGYCVPRQNGKSMLLLARAIAGALLFGEKKIIISAHLQDTAREIFNDFVTLRDENPLLDRKVKKVMTAINREYIEFYNGAKIQFKARTGAGGRGFSCDCLLLDEAQKLTRAAWVSINSTMSARPNPQVWLLGTVPTPEDESDVFTQFRQNVLEELEHRASWTEWGAEKTDDPALEETRRKANPAWDIRINHEVVEGEYQSYSTDEFAIDRLGIWPEHTGGSRLITALQWSDTAVTEAPTGGIKTFGVAFSHNGDRMSVCGAMHLDDTTHVEIVGKYSGSTEAGVAALAKWLAEPERKASTACIAISGGDAETLKAALLKLKVSTKAIKVLTTTDYVAATAMTYNAFKEKTVTHLKHDGQKVLDDSVEISDKKGRGQNGAWGWVPTTADGDETPVEAMSVALWAARTTKRKPGRKVKGAVR